MNRFTLVLILLASTAFASAQDFPMKNSVQVQIKELSLADYKGDTLRQFYNYVWRKCAPQYARYYSVAYKENDYWYCQDYYVQEKQLMTEGRYSDQELVKKEGVFVVLHPNGKIKSKGQYFQGFKTGKWFEFDEAGNNIDSALYLNGWPAGRNVSKYANGSIKEIKDMDRKGTGSGYSTAFYPSGQIKWFGRYTNWMQKDSTWNYFYPNGKLAFVATYQNDAEKNYTCYDTLGNPITECKPMRLPEFPGGGEKCQGSLRTGLNFHQG